MPRRCPKGQYSPRRGAAGQFEGSKGVVNAVDVPRSRIKVLESSAVSASAADCSPRLNEKGRNKKKEEEREREREREGSVEGRNKQKAEVRGQRSRRRVFYSFTLGRFAAKNRDANSFRARNSHSKRFAFDLYRDLITKRRRGIYRVFRASIVCSLEKLRSIRMQQVDRARLAFRISIPCT